MCAIGLDALMALIQTLPFECQRWILTSKQSSVLTRIAATKSVSLCVRIEG